MSSPAVLEPPPTTQPQPPVPAREYKTVSEIFARLDHSDPKERISLGNVLHDIKNRHYGITHHRSKEAAQAAATNDYALLAEIKQQRSDMLAEFVPPADGHRLFDATIGAMKKDSLFLSSDNITEVGMICLPEMQREKVYAAVRDLVLTKFNCTPDTSVNAEYVCGYAAASALIKARTQLFPTDKTEDIKKILRADLMRILDMSLDRAEQLRHDENVLTQCGYAVELVANFLDLDGYEDERLIVSSQPVLRPKMLPVYPVLLTNTFNGVGAGPVVVVAGRVDYLQEFRHQATAVPPEAQRFLERAAYGFTMRNMGRLNGQHPSPVVW